MAPTETWFPALTLRQFSMLVLCGIHPDVLAQQEALGVVRRSMLQLHRTMLMNTSSDCMVFENTVSSFLFSMPATPAVGGPPGPKDKSKTERKPRPARPATAPAGFRFLTPDELKKLLGGKCNTCGSSDHLFRDCKIPRREVRCSNHPACNCHFPHMTVGCPLVKVVPVVAVAATPPPG